MALFPSQIDGSWLTAAGIAAAAHAAAITAVLVSTGGDAERLPQPVMIVELAAGLAPQPALAPKQAETMQPSQSRPVAAAAQVARPLVPVPDPVALPQPRPVPHNAVTPAPQPSPAASPAAPALVASAMASATVAPSGTGGGPGSNPAGKAAEADWYSLISAHLERNKRYPREAKQAGEQGTPVVRFSVDRRGRVTAIGIANSSGHPLLDQATVELLRRVSPLPAMPRAIGRDNVTISLPIEYSLSRK